MADVAIPAAWIAQGTLPPICARHGGPATRHRRRRFDTRTPTWVLALVLIALLLAAIVALALRKSVQGEIPECEQCVRDQRRFKLTVVGAWVGDVVVLLLAVNFGGAGLILWLLVTLAALIWSFAGGQRYRVHGTLSKDQQWVAMRGSSEEFAAAIDAVVRPTEPVVPPQPVAPAQELVPVQPEAAPQPVPVTPEPVAVEPVAVEPVAPPESIVSAPEPEPVAQPPLHAGLPTRPTILPKF